MSDSAIDHNDRSPGLEVDQELLELMDRFQAAIDAGDHQACEQLLAEHPQHQGVLRCLLSLGDLASVPVSQADVAASEAPTRSLSESTRWSSSVLRLESGPLAFGRYLLVGKVGQGGMGAVFRAEQPELQREVAVKIILGGELATDEQVRRFQQEAQAAASLRHPNIVAIHDVGLAEGLHFFTMDFMPGGSLSERLKQRSYTSQEAAQIILPLARAVDYLHSRGVIHRDLKPSNVMFDDDDRPCLTDFGLAKVFSGDSGCTRTGDVLGTASYMAPEQASGQVSLVSPLSDVYGLGALLYEMLTGRPPHAGESFVDTILRVMEGEPANPRSLNREVDRELEQICLRCLEKRPEDRYGSAGALAADLQRFLQGDPVETRTGGAALVARRTARRYPALTAHCLILVAVAVIVAGRNAAIVGANQDFWLIEGLLAMWAALSFALQWFQSHDAWKPKTQLAWAVVDPLFITALIHLAEPPRESLLTAYPAFIAAAGLWAREKLVAAATLASVAGYGLLLCLQPSMAQPMHHPIILVSLMILVGFVMGFQVRRLRLLNQCV